MNKPHIICYMMTSIDGRIDCAMTSKLNGVEDYYKELDELNIPSTLSGRITAQLELALPGEYISADTTKENHNCFSKKINSDGYDIIVDTNGKLLWDNDSNYEKPHIIITSQKVTKEYLSYLDSKNISWIVVGKDNIDLAKASEILFKEFNVKRLGIVGGPKINTAFLKANLLDEIVLFIGVGIDARIGYTTLFDGLDENSDVIPLQLNKVKSFESGAVMISYKTIK